MSDFQYFQKCPHCEGFYKFATDECPDCRKVSAITERPGKFVDAHGHDVQRPAYGGDPIDRSNEGAVIFGESGTPLQKGLARSLVSFFIISVPLLIICLILLSPDISDIGQPRAPYRASQHTDAGKAAADSLEPLYQLFWDIVEQVLLTARSIFNVPLTGASFMFCVKLTMFFSIPMALIVGVNSVVQETKTSAPGERTNAKEKYKTKQRQERLRRRQRGE